MMRQALLLLSMLSLCLGQIQNFPWPIAPMNEQHRISSTFDECREDRDHFHNGTDMPLAPGGNVLSIMAGQVTGIGGDWIRVEDFAYVHVDPNPTLQVGNTVAQGAVVGWTDSYAHIHLNYGGGNSGHPTGNPLLPNRIQPFADPYHPRSPIIQFVMDGTHTAFPSNNLSGRVDIVAQAADTTDLESTIDMNNGIYRIGWALYDSDTSEVLVGPQFWFQASQLYSNAYINNVYAPGSSTSIYRYIVTNRISSNGFLDCDAFEPGPYVVSVMSVDTRDNWDTTYVRINITDEDLLPPGQPELTYVGPDADGQLYLEWMAPDDADLGGYILEFSFNGTTWNSNHGPDVITSEMTSFTVEGFPENSFIMFRLKAVDNAPIPNQSELSDTYGVRLNSSGPKILVVDGFDRINGSWTDPQHDFATYYLSALDESDFEGALVCASNEWVQDNNDLSAYEAVFWFTGDDSRTDETFSTNEQSIVSNYLLNEGGRLFASGAEIAYDLVGGTAADESFMEEILHLQYAGDHGESYHINGEEPLFSEISFDYGTEPYEEDWPDHFSTVNGGEVCLRYGNNRIAAVGYRDDAQSTFVLGLAFETVEGVDNRGDLIQAVLNFFETPARNEDAMYPVTPYVSAVYPNPFNASINISILPSVDDLISFSIYDLKGRRVYEHHEDVQAQNAVFWQWDGQNQNHRPLASGTYVLQIRGRDFPLTTRKLLLLK